MTPSTLVKVVAKTIDVPEPVMIQHDRRIAEAGFRTMGGRGASAPDMTLADAAKLIIAGVSLPKGDYSQTLSFVRGLWNAKPAEKGLPDWLRPKFPALSRAKDNPTSTFGDALTALLQDCADGHMKSFVDEHRGESFCLELMPEFWGTAWLKFADGDNEAALEFRGHTSGVAAVRVSIHRISATPLIKIAETFVFADSIAKTLR